MPARVGPVDASFLYADERPGGLHVGELLIFDDPDGGLTIDRLAALVGERLPLVPRFRQKVREVPGRVARPVWVDDPGFDLDQHVRRAALARPGGPDQLDELVGRVMGRPLKRSRPLWEVYLVDGLAGDQVAVLTKTHPVLVGEGALDLGQLLFDDPRADAQAMRLDERGWRPAREPTSAELFVGGVVDAVRTPAAVAETVRRGLGDAGRLASRAAALAGDLLETARLVAAPHRASVLGAPVGTARTFVRCALPLDQHRAVRAAHDVSVNDVVLAVVTGGLRAWLLARGEPVATGDTVPALVPVAVTGDRGAVAVTPVLVALPVGEQQPIVRLQQVAHALRGHADSGRAVGARALAELAGFAPPTVHAWGARATAPLSRRAFDVVVTNVPGPQAPRQVAGALMVGAFPVVPLGPFQPVSVGVTSYLGEVCYGVTVDRDSVADATVLRQCLIDALDELLAHAGR